MCDWLAGEVLAFAPDGTREVVARVEGLPFSIDWLPDGRLVVTTNGGVAVGSDLTPYGAAGQPFNEIVVDSASLDPGDAVTLTFAQGRAAAKIVERSGGGGAADPTGA